MNEKFDPYVAEWVTFATNPSYSLVQKCLKIAENLEFPNLKINEYLQKLDQMGKTLQYSLSDSKNPTYLISMLNEYLFNTLGFVGDTEDYYNPRNNFLNIVIDQKRGLPITLSIIFTELAKHIGLNLQLVGFPGHFLVKYKEEMIFDPFNKGRLLGNDDLRQLLYQHYGEEVKFSPELLNEIDTKKILFRILRNLKNSYAQSFSYNMAMRCTDMILVIEQNSPEEIRDKGILESRLLHYDSALKFLNRYLELVPETDDADFVLELIRSIREKSNL